MSAFYALRCFTSISEHLSYSTRCFTLFYSWVNWQETLPALDTLFFFLPTEVVEPSFVIVHDNYCRRNCSCSHQVSVGWSDGMSTSIIPRPLLLNWMAHCTWSLPQGTYIVYIHMNNWFLTTPGTEGKILSHWVVYSLLYRDHYYLKLLRMWYDSITGTLHWFTHSALVLHHECKQGKGTSVHLSKLCGCNL